METTTIALLAVCLITAGSLIGIFMNMKAGFGPFNLKVYGLTLVVGFSALIALADIASDKLTAVIGILGAVAGYLFGLKKEN